MKTVSESNWSTDQLRQVFQDTLAGGHGRAQRARDALEREFGAGWEDLPEYQAYLDGDWPTSRD